jgi:hypothetical protein
MVSTHTRRKLSMRQITRRGGLAVISALLLVPAGCSVEEVVDEPDGAAAAEAAADGSLAEEAAAPDDGDPQEEPAPVAPGEVTAYVVGYHWGWAVFDEHGEELDVLEVPVGTEVELVAVNDHASHAIDQLPDPVAEAIRSISWHERAHHDVEMGRMADPAATEGMTLSDALTAAHDGHDHVGPRQDHGLMVTGVGVEVFLDSHADEPERLVFIVEHEGEHEFRCTEECGVGHESQRWKMLVVTA